MADFDPDAYLAAGSGSFNPDAYLASSGPAVAVTAAPSDFDPDAYLKQPRLGADEIAQSAAQQQIEANAGAAAPQWANNAADAAISTVGGFIPQSAYTAASFATPVVSAVHDLGRSYSTIKDWIGGKPLLQSYDEHFPESLALVEADKTPPYSKERFAAAFNTLAQLGMIAGGVKGLREHVNPEAALTRDNQPTTPQGGEVNASSNQAPISGPEVAEQGVNTSADPARGTEAPVPPAEPRSGAIPEGAQGTTGAPIGGTEQPPDVVQPLAAETQSPVTGEEISEPAAAAGITESGGSTPASTGGVADDYQPASGGTFKSFSDLPDSPTKQAAESAATEHVAERAAVVPPERVTTGVANRVLDAEAEAGHIGEVQPGEGMTWQEMVGRGRELLNGGADPLAIARRLDRNGRISADDFAVIRAERERLAIETDNAARTARAQPDNPLAQANLARARESETNWVRNVVQPAKTATSDIFRGMQGEAPIDVTTFEGLRRGVVDTTGKEPPPNLKPVLERRAFDVRQKQSSEAATGLRLSQAIEKNLPREGVPATLEELRAEMAKMAEQLQPCRI